MKAIALAIVMVVLPVWSVVANANDDVQKPNYTKDIVLNVSLPAREDYPEDYWTVTRKVNASVVDMNGMPCVIVYGESSSSVHYRGKGVGMGVTCDWSRYQKEE